MKVIFLRDVKGIGRRNDVKEVSDGYARNFLIPKGIAKAATDADVKELGELQRRREARENALRSELLELAKTLSAEPLKIYVSAGAKGELFASVGGEKILEELRKKCSRPELLEDAKAKLEKPIKAVGEYDTEVDFGLGVVAEIKLLVQPLRSESSHQT